ncbi:sulfite exporter TauE/SafE family protein [bacterium]|nr:sulfite exporter TauE/SafE family protein [bacterium]
MNTELTVLYVTAASIGFFHTLFGPDHYLPFIVMSKARNWSIAKTSWITFLCGLGHVLSSVVLGFIGIALGIGVSKLEFFEGFRGEMAGWALMTFGFVYLIWGLRIAIKNKPHKHMHIHSDGTSHAHDHAHNNEHAHVHEEKSKTSLVPWTLFVIFVLGPCEPLIPILMYPAAKNDIFGVIAVTTIFSVITISTMMAMVLVTIFGINLLPLKKMERYSHALAGGAIFASGIAINFLGL